MMLETLQRLTALAGPKGLNWLAKNDQEKLLAITQEVWGEGATLDTYVRFITEFNETKDRGEQMADMVLVYGVGVLSLPADQQAALKLALPYARGRITLAAADAHAVTSGGIGSAEYFLALAGGDSTVARRLHAEEIARKAVSR